MGWTGRLLQQVCYLSDVGMPGRCSSATALPSCWRLSVEFVVCDDRRGDSAILYLILEYGAIWLCESLLRTYPSLRKRPELRFETWGRRLAPVLGETGRSLVVT